MDHAIPHPTGLFSGRVAARFAAAGWASGVRRARPRFGRRAVIGIAIGAQLGLLLLGAQILREIAAQHAQEPVQPYLWSPADGPATLPSDDLPALPAPAAPDLAPAAPLPSPEAVPVMVPPGRLADTSSASPAAAEADDGRTLVTVIATGYCPCALCCGEFADGFTAIMRDARRHRGIAVDPTMIPYRTMLSVPGYGRAMVDDTGEAMRRDGARGVVHLDLRFRTHAEAKAWGVKRLTVAVPGDCRAASAAGLVLADEDDVGQH